MNSLVLDITEVFKKELSEMICGNPEDIQLAASTDSRVYQWIENKCQDTLNKSLTKKENLSTSIDLNTLMAEYINSIGDIDESLVGADFETDVMLRKNFSMEGM